MVKIIEYIVFYKNVVLYFYNYLIEKGSSKLQVQYTKM